MQVTRPERREVAANQAGGDNLLRPLTTLELGQPPQLYSSTPQHPEPAESSYY